MKTRGVVTRAGLASVLLGTTACATAPPAEQVSAVRQAVFSQQVSYWLGDHARESGVVVCLGTSDGSGASEVAASVSAEQAARRAADCVASPTGAVERATSRPAVIVRIVGISWRGSEEATVEVEHFRSAAVSGRRKYRVVRERGVWVCLGEPVDMTPA